MDTAAETRSNLASNKFIVQHDYAFEIMNKKWIMNRIVHVVVIWYDNCSIFYKVLWAHRFSHIRAQKMYIHFACFESIFFYAPLEFNVASFFTSIKLSCYAFAQNMQNSKFLDVVFGYMEKKNLNRPKWVLNCHTIVSLKQSANECKIYIVYALHVDIKSKVVRSVKARRNELVWHCDIGWAGKRRIKCSIETMPPYLSVCLHFYCMPLE